MMSIWPGPALCRRPFWKAGRFVIVHFQGGISSWSGASSRVCSAGVVLVCHQCPAWTRSLLGRGAVEHTCSCDGLSRKGKTQEFSSKGKSFQRKGIFHFSEKVTLSMGMFGNQMPWNPVGTELTQICSDSRLWGFWPPSTFSKPHLIELVLKTSEEKYVMRKEGELCGSGVPYCPGRTASQTS